MNRNFICSLTRTRLCIYGERISQESGLIFKATAHQEMAWTNQKRFASGVNSPSHKLQTIIISVTGTIPWFKKKCFSEWRSDFFILRMNGRQGQEGMYDATHVYSASPPLEYLLIQGPPHFLNSSIPTLTRMSYFHHSTIWTLATAHLLIGIPWISWNWLY